MRYNYNFIILLLSNERVRIDLRFMLLVPYTVELLFEPHRLLHYAAT